MVLALCLLSTSLWSQFDPFKYVVVPIQFEAFKQANMHNTSTMVKYYLEQRGLPALYDVSKPSDLVQSPCIGAYTQFIDDSNMIATRVILRFVDCEGKIIFETVQGKSKEKEYKVSYKEAIEQAFLSFDGVTYSYTPPKRKAAAATVGAGSKVIDTEAVASKTAEPEPVAAQATEPTSALASTKEPEVPKAAAIATISSSETLYAQPIEGGYQLVDSSPKIRMLLMESDRDEGVYMAVVEGNSAGTVYRDGDNWVHVFFRDGEIVRTPLNIKF